MNFCIEKPSDTLSDLIENYWGLEDDSVDIRTTKIIPDGFPELIFHLKSPYRTNIGGKWETQSHCLIAGQIKKYFLLENTGKTEIFAVKLKPWALNAIFEMPAFEVTDKVIPMELNRYVIFKDFIEALHACGSFKDRVHCANQFFSANFSVPQNNRITGKAIVIKMLAANGGISLKKIYSDLGLQERSVQRYFKNNIGLSPKFYSRILRFAHLVRLGKAKNKKWTEITYYAGFYDQSHFIRNFKEFTGEEPTVYGFTAQSLGNFFFD